MVLYLSGLSPGPYLEPNLESYLGCCLGESTQVFVSLAQGSVVDVHVLVRLGVNPLALVVPVWDVPLAALVALVVGPSECSPTVALRLLGFRGASALGRLGGSD